MTVYCL